MADGLCSGAPVGNLIEKTLVKKNCDDLMMDCDDGGGGGVGGEEEEDSGCSSSSSGGIDNSRQVNKFYLNSASDKLFVDKLCSVAAVTASGRDKGHNHHQTTITQESESSRKHGGSGGGGGDDGGGFLSCVEDDCRKKRCVDRYDSSESSDSGVAVLSCTDCSGSSTASSDITDPGSPFSTASSHSEDSGSGGASQQQQQQQQQSTKMPPTQQTAHHPHWPWTTTSTITTTKATTTTGTGTDDGQSMKRCMQQQEKKTALPKRLKSDGDNTTSKQSPPCLNNNNINLNNNNNNNNNSNNNNNTCSNSNMTSLNNNINNNNNNNNKNSSSSNHNNKVSFTLLSSVSSKNSDMPSPNVVKKLSNKINNNNNYCTNNNNGNNKIDIQTQTSKQGKITEYFKSQIKLHVIKKETAVVATTSSSTTTTTTSTTAATITTKSIGGIGGGGGDIVKTGVNNLTNKYVSLVDQQTQFNGIKASIRQTTNKKLETISSTNKIRKLTQITVPRKILPAPSKLADVYQNQQQQQQQQQQQEQQHLTHQNHHVNSLANFTPTVTLTAVGFPSNLAYLHTKTPKPPDNNSNSNSIFVPQFATISSDGINTTTIPIINKTTPCLNVIQPIQKITTINNFNCVKLNATVVPIVKLNTLPSRLNSTNLTNITVPTTVLSSTLSTLSSNSSVKPKLTNDICPPPPPLPPATLPLLLPPPAIVPTTTTPSTRCNVVVEQQQQDESFHQQTKCPDIDESLSSQSSDDVTRIDDKSSTSSSDSGLLLSENLKICISETITTTPQKSPILSQPKTIRFPVRQHIIKEEIKDVNKINNNNKTTTAHSTESGLCRWAECNAQFDTNGALLEHLQVKHVISQATQEQYVCLWLGCKVHGRTSCSRSWLERHVLAHAGTKPFRCIVDGCGQRFNSQLTLERHVNGHFNSDGSQNSNNAKKSTENSCTKLLKRNGKKIRFRRQPWSARMFDFIDSGIMEGLQHKLLTLTQNRTQGQISNADGDTVDVVSQILARRIQSNGQAQFLIRWHPADIIPDEWVTENEFVKRKSVPIPSLKPEAKTTLHDNLFQPTPRSRRWRRKLAVTKQL